MNQTKLKHLLSLRSSVLSLGIGLVVHTSGVQSGYLVDSAGDVVRTGAQKCWNIKGGLEGPIEACGDVIEVAAVEELDSDGDGVPDSRDKCPDTPKGVEVDENGCPKDADGDGVPDYLDKCPGTPAGTKVDAQGCEIIDDLVLQVTTDHFRFDSAELEPGMLAELDEVLAKLEASPGQERLVIIGHTDSTGPEDYNQGLSERRASSVADY
ncbi:MAG: OmpA family protein, partial [Gammaproteobacteria bacterium]|nr:OmpA family protein [Gammaproteobacteria bacterium]